ncbi:uncharacterized protein LOC141665283 [Apium graveolens]|uniref:uncharacterized protein LOC141665283 n=1 Tax=Apium graveolens TaxID=4045 RepID=UPI003D79E977
MTLADGNEQWKQPPKSMIKINTDAALFEESNTYAYSIIPRDHKGDLIEARTSGNQGYIDPVMAEAVGRVVNECKELLIALQNQNVKFNFVKRSANKVAHTIARNSISVAKRSWSKCDALPHYFRVLFDELKF